MEAVHAKSLTAAPKTEPRKTMQFVGVVHKSKYNKWPPTNVKAAVVKDPPAAVITTPVNLTTMIDDMLNSGEVSAAA